VVLFPHGRRMLVVDEAERKLVDYFLRLDRPNGTLHLRRTGHEYRMHELEFARQLAFLGREGEEVSNMRTLFGLGEPDVLVCVVGYPHVAALRLRLKDGRLPQQ